MTLRSFGPSSILVFVCTVGVVGLVDVGAHRSEGIADESPVANETIKPESVFSPYVDRNGNISLPTRYKQEWAHLGSWAVAKKAGQKIHEMHDVYTRRETIAEFRKTGKFPDGAVLVKEVRNAEVDRLTTGHAAWSTDVKIWFVMIKDRKDRFEDSDHWGAGWGWALFEAKDPSKNVSVGYDTSCISCHAPVEDTDWVYVHGYPELKKP